MKLHVGNLPKDINNEQFNSIATPFGAVESAEIVFDRTNGESRGYGFLVFSSADDARAAITGLDGKDINGQVIRVSEARSPKDRERPRA